MISIVSPIVVLVELKEHLLDNVGKGPEVEMSLDSVSNYPLCMCAIYKGWVAIVVSCAGFTLHVSGTLVITDSTNS